MVLVLVAVPGSDGSVGASHQFPDVSDTHHFHAEIAWLADMDITAGFVDGTFRPDGKVTRQWMAAFLHRLWTALGGIDADQVPDPGFSDVTAGDRFFDDIAWLADIGVGSGLADGSFGPELVVSRQWMAAFLHRLFLELGGVDSGATPDPGFSDVSLSHPFFDDIAWLADSEITIGALDGSFGPKLAVTRGAMSAFLLRFWTNLVTEVDSSDDVDDFDPGDGSCDRDAPPKVVGDCTLRAAISESNATAGHGYLQVIEGVDPILSISGTEEDSNVTGDLDVTDALTILGQGSVVDGDLLDRVFDVHATHLDLHGTEVRNGSVGSQSGGGIRVEDGSLTMENVLVEGNTARYGGGVYGWPGPIVIRRSALTGNTASDHGGALYLSGTPAAIVDSTIDGNTADEGGGAWFGHGATIIRSTVTDNAGTGVHGHSHADVHLAGSVVTGIGAGCSGRVVSDGYNLGDDGTCHLDQPGDLDYIDPGLGATGTSGGPTPGRLPSATSPVIDAIPVGVGDLCEVDSVDQAGVERTDDGWCNRGSIEGDDGVLVSPLDLLVDNPADLPDQLPGDGLCDVGDGTCTLRAAVDESNSVHTADSITIAIGVDPLVLGAGDDLNSSGDLDVYGPLTVFGQGATITNYGSGRLIDQHEFSIVLHEVNVLDGGILATMAQLTMNGGSVHSAVEAGIELIDTDATVSNATISDNRDDYAGGLAVWEGSHLEIRDSLVTGNSSTIRHSGLWVDDDATAIVSRVTFTQNDGRSTIAGESDSHVEIWNSTIVDNRSRNGWHNVSIPGEIWTSTITADPESSAVGAPFPSTLSVRGSIIWADTPCGYVTTSEYNLVPLIGCIGAPTEVATTDAVLGPLAHNGGPTPTLLPLTGSPLLDAIPNATPGLCDATTPADQRGLPRPAIAATACDIGSVERQPADL